MSRHHLFAIAATLAFTVIRPDVADAALSVKNVDNVSFDAVATGGLKIKATTNSLSAKEAGDDIRLTVDLTTLSTGIDIRDTHMKRALGAVDKDNDDKAYEPHKTAELRVAKAKLQFPSDADTSGDVEGQFTLNGKTKPVTVHYTAKAGSKITVDGNFVVTYTDFIAEQSYMGIRVKKEEPVTVKATFGVKRDD